MNSFGKSHHNAGRRRASPESIHNRPSSHLTSSLASLALISNGNKAVAHKHESAHHHHHQQHHHHLQQQQYSSAAAPNHQTPTAYFTPSDTPLVFASSSRSSSSAHIAQAPSPDHPLPELSTWTWSLPMPPTNRVPDSDEDTVVPISFGKRSNRESSSLRPRKGISTSQETETEDEPNRQLPTSRILPRHEPIIPPPKSATFFNSMLFMAFRMLSIVPAVIGTFQLLSRLLNSQEPPQERVDAFASCLWSILTGIQCFLMTSGLLMRWKAYYAPSAALIRLLALQAICWPATYFTLEFLNGQIRPLVCWSVIGTTTCVSRSIQMWVTSNLWDDSDDPSPSGTPPSASSPNGRSGGAGRPRKRSMAVAAMGLVIGEKSSRGGSGGSGGPWRGRKWDWTEVCLKCLIPAGFCYFAMAWTGVVNKELTRGSC